MCRTAFKFASPGICTKLIAASCHFCIANFLQFTETCHRFFFASCHYEPLYEPRTRPQLGLRRRCDGMCRASSLAHKDSLCHVQEFAALAVAVPMAITAVSADSNRKALVEKARLEAHNTIVVSGLPFARATETLSSLQERKRLRDEKAAMQAVSACCVETRPTYGAQAEELKKKEAKARLEERIAAAKAEQLRIESNQDAVLNAEKERAAAKAAAIRAAAAAKEGASATRSLT